MQMEDNGVVILANPRTSDIVTLDEGPISEPLIADESSQLSPRWSFPHIAYTRRTSPN